MKIVKQHGWVFYIGNNIELYSRKVGKWMYFFNDRRFVERICTEAVEQGIVVESKHSDNNKGVACFYLHVQENIRQEAVDLFSEAFSRKGRGTFGNVLDYVKSS